MKTALKYFQLAAGIYLYSKDYVNTNSMSDSSIDFEPAVLASLSWLMLAQAVEIIYIKSSSARDEITAKVAAHASDCYKEAYTSAKTESARVVIPKNYINMMLIKHLLFQSKIELHAGKHAQTFNPVLRATQDEINKIRIAARKDNDYVYHERVPDARTLETIMAQQIAKPSPVHFPSTGGDFKCYYSIPNLILIGLCSRLI